MLNNDTAGAVLAAVFDLDGFGRHVTIEEIATKLEMDAFDVREGLAVLVELGVIETGTDVAQVCVDDALHPTFDSSSAHTTMM